MLDDSLPPAGGNSLACSIISLSLWGNEGSPLLVLIPHLVSDYIVNYFSVHNATPFLLNDDLSAFG